MRHIGTCAVALAIATALTLITGCAPGGATTRVGPTAGALERRLVGEVAVDGAVTHLEALQDIADRNGGNRASGTPGYEASVDYVVEVLRDAGFEVGTPEYPAPATRGSGGRGDGDGEDGERGRGGGSSLPGRNVVAQTGSGDTGNVIMLGAHLDSVPRGPGINDNGTGVATLLEIAKALGPRPRVANAVRFAFWGSEEVDLNGSTHYVRTLSAGERKAISLYLNLDMLGSPNPGYFVQGGVGRTASRTGPAGSEQVAKALVDRFAAAGVKAETTTFDGESDYDAFVGAGIPAGGLLSGDSNTKSDEQAQAWGGTADQVFDDCYHQACDRLDNVDRTALEHFMDAVAGTTAHFAELDGGLAR